MLSHHLPGRPGRTFDLDLLVQKTEGFSGAEIEQLVISALYSAFSGPGNLSTELILEEIGQTRPLPVTMEEKIESLRDWAKERTVPAGGSVNPKD